MSNAYEIPCGYSRLEPRTPWTGSRMTEIDLLTLKDAARFATKHAGADVTESELLCAAARGEILLRAMVHDDAKVTKHDGGIYCNAGLPTENLIPKGALPTLPVSACRQLANTGRASWRTIDGYKVINGELMRYEVARLMDGEPDFSTTVDDCRVTCYDVHALADKYVEARDNAVEMAPAAAPPFNQNNAERQPNITRHKLRMNSLDEPIRKAIKMAGSLNNGAVFVHLREIALNSEAPFTGAISADSLYYTNDDNKTEQLTKNALRKRLKRHHL